LNEKIEQQIEHFDQQALHYIKARNNFRHKILTREMWKPIFDILSSEISTDEAVKVLEPMCGTCIGYSLLGESKLENFQYNGFDYSANMVKAAQSLYSDINVWKQDVTTFESENLYDLIIIVGGLHHIPVTLDLVVKNLSSSLKKGGFFVVSEPVNNNFILKLIRDLVYSKNNSFDEETERAFTTNELHKCFLNNGLTPYFESYPCLLAYILWGCPEAFPFLNKGSESFVKKYVKFEKLMWRTWLAKYISFGLFSIYKN